MKKVVAVFAGVAVAGLALAADVTTANTAVVIRKAAVESDTGYQFLCVPVRGFDITGQGSADGVPLNDVLPPDTPGFSDKTTLTIEGNSTESGYAANTTWALRTVGESLTWVPTTPTTSGEASRAAGTDGTALLQNGAKLWLNAQGISFSFPSASSASDEETGTATPSETVFCGEQVVTTTKLIAPEAGMLAYGNNTSEPKDIFEIADLRSGDQLLRVQDGSSEYRTYIYYNDGQGMNKWVLYRTNGGSEILPLTEEGTELDVTPEERTIAPGEAFYFYRVANAQ